MVEAGEGEAPPIVPVEKIVTPLELEATTMAGWEVVESLSFDGTIQWGESVPTKDPNGYSVTNWVQHTSVGKQVAFRVRKKGSDQLALLQVRADTLQGLYNDLGVVSRNANEKLEREAKAHGETKEKLLESTKRFFDLEEKMKLAQGVANKYHDENLALEKELKDYERVKRVFGLRAISEALMKSDAVDVLKDASPADGG